MCFFYLYSNDTNLHMDEDHIYNPEMNFVSYDSIEGGCHAILFPSLEWKSYSGMNFLRNDHRYCIVPIISVTSDENYIMLTLSKSKQRHSSLNFLRFRSVF